jgi:hypothetical protein
MTMIAAPIAAVAVASRIDRTAPGAPGPSNSPLSMLPGLCNGTRPGVRGPNTMGLHRNRSKEAHQRHHLFPFTHRSGAIAPKITKNLQVLTSAVDAEQTEPD